MTSAALDPLAMAVLRALYELAALDCPAHAGAISRALALKKIELRAADVARVLLVLDARGLVVAESARLTMRGLATAVRAAPLGVASASWLPGLRGQAVQYRHALAARSGGGRA